MKNDNSVYMCMSCGNCKRKDGEDGRSFSFTCQCGEFVIDSVFASKIEFIGCRSWIPSDDNYNEPYIFVVDDKHKTVKLGKWGKKFTEINPDDLLYMNDAYEYEVDDTFNRIIEFCKEECGA